MKKLIWTVIVAVGLAALPFSGSAFAGQGHNKQAHKSTAKVGKAGKTGKHHGPKHQNKSAGKKQKHQ